MNNLTKYWLILIKPYGVDYINNYLSPFTSTLVLAITEYKYLRIFLGLIFFYYVLPNNLLFIFYNIRKETCT